MKKETSPSFYQFIKRELEEVQSHHGLTDAEICWEVLGEIQKNEGGLYFILLIVSYHDFFFDLNI